MTTLTAYLDRTADLSLDIGTTPLPGISVYTGRDKTDPKLRAAYAAAIDWVDQKLSSRDFTAAPPDSVVIGVYVHTETQMSLLEANPIASRVKTGQREEDYDAISNALALAGARAWPYIEAYCTSPLLFCSGGR